MISIIGVWSLELDHWFRKVWLNELALVLLLALALELELGVSRRTTSAGVFRSSFRALCNCIWPRGRHSIPGGTQQINYSHQQSQLALQDD
jgi:hypothetical protein